MLSARPSADIGRSYLHVSDRAAIADLDRRTAPTILVLASAPNGGTLAGISDLLLACRLIMTVDTAAVAVIGPLADEKPASTGQPHQLLAAATDAGLHPAGTILALQNPGHDDRYLYCAINEQIRSFFVVHSAAAAPPVTVALFTGSGLVRVQAGQMHKEFI